MKGLENNPRRHLLIATDGHSQHDRPIFQCMFCVGQGNYQAVFREPVLSWVGEKWVLSGEAAFHFYDTHGYHPEDILDMLAAMGARKWRPVVFDLSPGAATPGHGRL